MSRISRLLAVALVGLPIILPKPSTAQELPPVATLAPELRVPGVQPGDRVTLTLFKQDGVKLNDISGERTVDARGMLYLPFLEEVSVRGLSQTAVRDLLDESYERFYTGSVVEVTIEYRVNVTGAVRIAGPVFLPPNSTLTVAMAEAGGNYSEVDVSLQGGAADASRVQLTRRGYDTPIVINFRPMEANPEMISALIQSGDWLHVPPAIRSQLREDLLFAGNILAVLIGTVSLIVLIGQN